ncbi:MAG TPA: ABC transporter ATP-binding protein [Candidatus Choladousia intestinigallinarum]|nr:ABC transporter ATP-binding protein [Candidatus Choladousia intestinigallinarum]
MKPLLYYMKRYWYLYLLGFAGMAISVGLDMMAPQITRRIIDQVIGEGQTRLLLSLVLGLLGIGLGRAVFQYVKEFTYDYIGVTVGRDMRKDLFEKLQGMSVDFFDRHNTGEVMTRVKDDIDKVWSVAGFLGILAVEAAVETVMVLIFMVRLNPLLTLVPLIFLPLIGICAVRMEKGLGKVYDQISEETAALNTVAQENLAGVRTVKAFAKEAYEIKKFGSHNRKFYELNMRQARILADHQPVISFLGKSLLLGVVVAGGFLVMRGKMSLGDLGAFAEYANNVIWPMEILGWLSNDIASAFASWRKIRRISSEESQIREPDHPAALETIKGQVRFEGVGFEREGHEILKDISFTLEPGKTLGIMGMTGSGKTTLIQLLQRFYDVTEGRILLDGTDIRQLPLKQLRSSMAVVMQDVFLFSDTVSQNVRTGRKENLPEENVEWAARAAGAHGFIKGLSRQYETMIGERGVGLSGGQKQRISIARAIAKETPVLILDDATSALDMETEGLVQKNLKEMGKGSKIIIGHRVSAVRHADEILILRDRRIAERGTHEELLRKKGEYYRTWCVQSGHTEDERRREGEECL